MLRLDNTKRSCASSCLRKYFLEHVCHIRSQKGSTALRYGVVWHELMDAMYSHIAIHGWTRDGGAVKVAILVAQAAWEEYTKNQSFYEDYRTLPNLLTAFLNYVSHFAGDEGMLRILRSERAFEIPMELESEKEIRQFPDLKPFIFTGMIDLEVELNDRAWIIDHKTTGQDLGRQVERLQRSAQFIGYSYAASKTSNDTLPEGFLVVFHHLSAYKSKKTDTYGEPKIDFRRDPQIFESEDVVNWRESIFEQAVRIQRSERFNCWPMEYDSCHQFGRCSYTYICERNTDVEAGVIPMEGFRIIEPWDVVTEHKKKEARRNLIFAGEEENGS